MDGSRRAPSTSDVALGRKLSASYDLLKLAVGARTREPGWSEVFGDLAEYETLLRRYTKLTLASARVFEIGFGAKPFRLVVMRSMGVDAFGIDVEVPLLRPSLSRLLQIYRRNGLERLAKTVVRAAITDRRDWKSLATELKQRGLPIRVERSRMLIGNAAELDLPSNSIDLIVAEAVFEHVPRSSLEELVARLADWISPGGLALVRPDIFTGISGGHLTEWFPFRVMRDESKRSEPWEHLRKRRYPPNTTLNEMMRAEYRSLFQEHFVIAEEIVKYPDLGRKYLVGDVARDLAGYTYDELFSNRVLFVLRPLPSAPLKHKL